MSLQEAPIIITPVLPTGPAVEAPMPSSINVDQAGNVTTTWVDPQVDLRSILAPALSSGAAQHRNRAGFYLVAADPGAILVDLSWKEWDPWAEAPRSRVARGVLVLGGHAIERGVERITAILYRAQAVYIRATGEVLEP